MFFLAPYKAKLLDWMHWSQSKRHVCLAIDMEGGISIFPIRYESISSHRLRRSKRVQEGNWAAILDIKSKLLATPCLCAAGASIVGPAVSYHVYCCRTTASAPPQARQFPNLILHLFHTGAKTPPARGKLYGKAKNISMPSAFLNTFCKMSQHFLVLRVEHIIVSTLLVTAGSEHYTENRMVTSQCSRKVSHCLASCASGVYFEHCQWSLNKPALLYAATFPKRLKPQVTDSTTLWLL